MRSLKNQSSLTPLILDFGNHLRLERIRIYETPNCWADCVRN